MSPTALIINALALGVLGVAAFVDAGKARKALVVAARAFVGMSPMVLAIIILIGLLLGFVPPERISSLLGGESGIGGVLLATGLGAIMFVPALISFPLASSLLLEGASVSSVAAFITSLTMIGTVTLPIEIRELGWRFTLLRNGLGLIAAVGIALAMGAIL
jgi:uncharacterized membrane protein YraQ (UPF0718 family)